MGVYQELHLPVEQSPVARLVRNGHSSMEALLAGFEQSLLDIAKSAKTILTSVLSPLKQEIAYLEVGKKCSKQSGQAFTLPPPDMEFLHRRIFRPKILHRQFHLITTVLVIKHKKNE